MANIQNPLELNPTVGGKQYAAGISKSKMQSLVDEVNKVGDKYEKPAGGIPSSDLSSAVQGSLSKADESVSEGNLEDVIDGLHEEYGDPNRLNQLEDWGNIADEATLRSRLRNVGNLSQAHTQRISFTVGGKTGFAIVTYNGEEFYVEYTLGSNRYACKQDSNQSGGWTPWLGSTELETYEHLSDLDGRCDEQEADILAESNRAKEAEALLDERKADVEGSYESMAVGSAKTLEANTLTAVDFTKRVVPSSVGSGASKLSLLKGNTLVWNQMANMTKVENQTIQGVTLTKNADGSITISANSATTGKVNFLYATTGRSAWKYPSHKYFVKGTGNANIELRIYKNEGEGAKNVTINSAIISNLLENDFIGGFGFIVNTGFVGSVTFTPTFIDLTRMFGEGNEPSSVEEFEALFPRENYAYATPWLMNFQGQTLKTIGFNQWDEEWELGNISGNTGNKMTDTAMIRSKNFIPVLPNTTYYCNLRNIRIFEYGANKEYLSIWGTYTDTFTTSSNCSFILFRTDASYGTTYLHDICINISNPSLNGTYKPYMEDTLPLNVTTLKGKAEGSDTEVVMFPDGLKKAGNIYDEIDFANGIAIKRVGSVDLGTLSWGKQTTIKDNYRFMSYLSGCAGYPPNILANMVSEKYLPVTASDGYQALKVGISGYSDHGGRVLVYDPSYSDAATFKTAMQGVTLYYELATPIVYHFEPLNNVYRVEQGGTEEVETRDTITPEGYNPLTAPMRADIRYGVDVVGILGNLTKDYVSKESIQVFLSALGTQMGGTWSMTWNETTERYDFAFTPNT